MINRGSETIRLGYDPADLTVHPPPQEIPRVSSFFLYRCPVFLKNVFKGKPVLFGVIEIKRPKTWFFRILWHIAIFITLHPLVVDNGQTPQYRRATKRPMLGREAAPHLSTGFGPELLGLRTHRRRCRSRPLRRSKNDESYHHRHSQTLTSREDCSGK